MDGRGNSVGEGMERVYGGISYRESWGERIEINYRQRTSLGGARDLGWGGTRESIGVTLVETPSCREYGA